MSIIRYEIANAGLVASGAPAPIVRSTPEGTGEVLIRLDIETTLAEAGRAHVGNTIHSRAVVVNALRQLLQHLVAEAAQ